MPVNYTLARDPLLDRLAIQTYDKYREAYVPVGFIFAGEKDFPFDMERMTDNMKALLNDQEPPHEIAAGAHKIFYQKVEGAVMLRWQNEGEGTTRAGPLITVSEPASTADLGRALLEKMNRGFMKKLCDAVHTVEGPSAAPTAAPLAGYKPT